MFSIYDILTEADDDADATPAGGGDEGANDNEDENFDIDTSINVDDDTDDDNGAVDDTGGDDNGEDDAGGGEETYSGSSGGNGSIGDSEDEPVQRNTDLFATLSAEEQVIKIGELKKLYRDLYNSIDDVLHRINDMDVDEYSMESMNRVSLTLHNLKDYLSDYLTNQFNMRSYPDNDFRYNEILMVVNDISSVVDDLAKSKEKRQGNETDTDDDFFI